MKLNVQSIRFDADSKLINYIEKKVSKLSTFFDGIIDGEVFLRLEKGDGKHDNKVLEVKLNVPGGNVFAKETSSSFEAACDEAYEKLRIQLNKHKEKMIEKNRV